MEFKIIFSKIGLEAFGFIWNMISASLFALLAQSNICMIATMKFGSISPYGLEDKQDYPYHTVIILSASSGHRATYHVSIFARMLRTMIFVVAVLVEWCTMEPWQSSTRDVTAVLLSPLGRDKDYYPPVDREGGIGKISATLVEYLSAHGPRQPRPRLFKIKVRRRRSEVNGRLQQNIIKLHHDPKLKFA